MNVFNIVYFFHSLSLIPPPTAPTPVQHILLLWLLHGKLPLNSDDFDNADMYIL